MAAAGRRAGRVGAGLPGHDRDAAVPRPARLGPGAARDLRRARGCPSRWSSTTTSAARAGGLVVAGLPRAARRAHAARAGRLPAARHLRLPVRGGGATRLAVAPRPCRQLAARARQRIEERRQRFDADLRHGRELTDRFVVACATGDLAGLLSMLADDVVVWTDGGGKVRAAMRPVVGPHRSVPLPGQRGQEGARMASRRDVLNGQPATVFVEDGTVRRRLVLDILEGRSSGSASSRTPTSSRG